MKRIEWKTKRYETKQNNSYTNHKNRDVWMKTLESFLGQVERTADCLGENSTYIALSWCYCWCDCYCCCFVQTLFLGATQSTDFKYCWWLPPHQRKRWWEQDYAIQTKCVIHFIILIILPLSWFFLKKRRKKNFSMLRPHYYLPNSQQQLQ